MDKLKILMIICDGMGDRPTAELKNRTPLQYAKKDNLDRFAREGICGIMDPIGVGIRPGSDTAHISLLGYDPNEVYTGRGPFEAAGLNVDLRPGDVAFRCNFITVDEKLKVVDRRASRIKSGTHELAKSIDGMEINGVKILFKEGVEHRGVLVFRGKALSPYVTDTDPHAEGVMIKKAEPLAEAANITASVLNEFVARSYKILNDHEVNIKRMKEGKKPANMIVTRGAGIVPHTKNIKERYGLKGICVTGIPLIKGICRTVGMDAMDVDGATGGVDTDMNAKIRAVIKALKTHDFVLLNIKAPDIYGHDGDAFGKVKCIERIDDALGILKGEIDETIVALTADHSTPVIVGDHSGDPVPIAVVGKGVRVDDVKNFDEISGAKGGLGRIKGLDLMPLLLDLANRSKKFGA